MSISDAVSLQKAVSGQTIRYSQGKRGRFMVGDSTLSLVNGSDISLNGRHFKGTKGLWDLLTRNNVDRGL